MSGYSWISGISIFCYLFLLVSFVSSKSKERVIHAFSYLLIIMILWTGGSVGMRIQLWPSVYFWHHVSLLGMFMLPFGYYQFMLAFLDQENKFMRQFMFVFFTLVFALNYFTGFFIPLPEIIQAEGSIRFHYHYNWTIILLTAFIILALLPTFTVAWRCCRGNHIAFQQLKPVIAGILIIFSGNVLSTLPFFMGLPVDMLSGAVNAVFLFYALYKRKLFRITILLSKNNCIIIAMILGLVVFSDIAFAIHRALIYNVGLTYVSTLIIVACFLLSVVAALYFIIYRTTEAFFSRAERKREKLLAHFSEEITSMVSVEDILQLLAETIQAAIDVDRLFVMIQDVKGTYRICHTINPLDEKNFYFRPDHPLIAYCQKTKDCVLIQDFSRKPLYQSLWEKEKALFFNQQIECVVPLNGQQEPCGFVLLGGKPGKSIASSENLNYLRSVANVCAGAVSNAHTYEQAIAEAQKDDLTGLVNFKFFFEILDREFEKFKDSALSLCLLNIDDFKLYNQLYGTQEGDIALKRIAAILKSSINETAYAARINGDEFALILPGYDISSAKCLADNIAEEIGNISVSETAGRISVSIGICAAPYMASSSKELYRNAETTVYTVKRTGKNAVQMYSADILRRSSVTAAHHSGYSEHASTVYALTAAIDAKDHYTFQHSQNVAYYAAELAKAANMASNVVEIAREAGLLHDIGKIGIREEILNKPEKLTPDEFEVMKSHVENAVNIIRHLPSLDYVIPAVLSHHERYDGRGYPRKLAGDNIPITGRILSIADSFDAMTSSRNYKGALPIEQAIEILRSEAGKQFDPNLVEAFVGLLENGNLELNAPRTVLDKAPEQVFV